MNVKRYVGIDIGGTKIKGVLMEGLGIQRSRSATLFTPHKKPLFFEALEKIYQELAGQERLEGIGVGVPGIVDPRRGVLVKAPHLSFLDGWNVKSFFKKWVSDVRVDNDSRCFLRAEALWGAGKKHRTIIGVTVGTGIGGGIMIEGKIYYGSHRSAGEFGHMMIEKGVTFERLGARSAAEHYGDRSEIIGVGVANIINAFDPDMIILGGGGVMSGALSLGRIRSRAQKFIMSPASKKTPIVAGMLGEEAQAIGAALLFLSREK